MLFGERHARQPPAQRSRGLVEVVAHGRLKGRQVRHLPVEGLDLGRLTGQHALGVRRPPQHPQGLKKDADSQRVDRVAAVVPQALDHLAGAGLGDHARLNAEARVGELVETVWDHRTEKIDPLAVRIYVEALRLLRRAPHAESMLSGEASEQEGFNWQTSRLTALEPALTDFLQEAPSLLCERLQDAPDEEHRDFLLALIDLRAEAGEAVIPLLARPRYPHTELVLEVLTWSSHLRIAPLLREWVLERVPMVRRAQRRRKAVPPRRPSVSAELPYRAILRTLRGHPSPQTEAFLLLAARDWDPTIRLSAVSSLGWWEPMQRHDVLLTLQDARRDPNPEVRQAARAALARLGERQALQWFRQTLTSEDPQRVHDTIQTVAGENLTLLWPDLDRLADAEDSDVAHHAREALERLCEDMNYRHN